MGVCGALRAGAAAAAVVGVMDEITGRARGHLWHVERGNEGAVMGDRLRRDVAGLWDVVRGAAFQRRPVSVHDHSLPGGEIG